MTGLNKVETKIVNKIKELEEIGIKLKRLKIKEGIKEELGEFETKFLEIKTANKIEALKQTEK